MKKQLRFLLTLILVLFFSFFIFGFIDYNRFMDGKIPIFIINKDILNDGGTTIYYGVGYQLIDWKIIDSEEIIKIKYKVGKELHVLRYINPLTDKPNVELEIVEEYYE